MNHVTEIMLPLCPISLIMYVANMQVFIHFTYFLLLIEPLWRLFTVEHCTVHAACHFDTLIIARRVFDICGAYTSCSSNHLQLLDSNNSLETAIFIARK